MVSFLMLKDKANWVRRETLRMHKYAPETRLASSLSIVEILVVLYYANILKFKAKNPKWDKRDRLIISKAHGGISLYPILADLKFFGKNELSKIGHNNSLLSIVPDPLIPGFETHNGSLGHGLGVACGMALGLKQKKMNNKIFVICGDGELNEGSMWEAIMFASYHRLGNLILIVDNNKRSMLGYQKDILGLCPLVSKFKAFGWKTISADGHKAKQLYRVFSNFKKNKIEKPWVLIANTVKGKGVSRLEQDPLCHIKSLSCFEADKLIGDF